MEYQFKKLYFILMGIGWMMVSCSGRSGSGGGFSVNEEDPIDYTQSACPDFMPLDDDISNAYPGGVSVFSDEKNLGCLTFVRRIQLPITGSQPKEYNYGIINQRGYLFNLNDSGQISATGEPRARDFVSFVQLPSSDSRYTGMLTRGHFGACQISYMPQEIADVKDERYPNAGDLKFFYAYKVEGDSDITYGCLDISGEYLTKTEGSHEFYVLQTKTNSTEEAVETWTKDSVNIHGGIGYGIGGIGYYDGKVLDQNTCLQGAFGQNTIPDYRGTITFRDQEDNEISKDAIINLAKDSSKYCTRSDLSDVAKERCDENQISRIQQLPQDQKEKL